MPILAIFKLKKIIESQPNLFKCSKNILIATTLFIFCKFNKSLFSVQVLWQRCPCVGWQETNLEET